jgi:hypothetical protein
MFVIISDINLGTTSEIDENPAVYGKHDIVQSIKSNGFKNQSTDDTVQTA